MGVETVERSESNPTPAAFCQVLPRALLHSPSANIASLHYHLNIDPSPRRNLIMKVFLRAHSLMDARVPSSRTTSDGIHEVVPSIR